MGAALAYFSIFSIAPILVVIIAIASVFVGEDAASGQLETWLSEYLGGSTAKFISSVVHNAHLSDNTYWTMILGVVGLLMAATGVFSSLKASLHHIWDIESRPDNSILHYLRTRAISLGLVMGLGLLLFVTITASTIMTGFVDQLANSFPKVGPSILVLSSWLLSTVVTIFIFAMLFRFLPDASISWKDIWAGALFTGLLFSLGRWIISLYIGEHHFSTTYGAAGALVTLLVWAYYNAQIFMLGAAFSEVWATTHGRTIRPSSAAVNIEKTVVSSNTAD